MVKTGKNGENIKGNPPNPAAPQPPAPRCCPVGKPRPKTPTSSRAKQGRGARVRAHPAARGRSRRRRRRCRSRAAAPAAAAAAAATPAAVAAAAAAVRGCAQQPALVVSKGGARREAGHSRAAKAGQHLRPYLAHFPLIFLRFSPVVPALVRGGRKARRDGERTAKDGRETAEKRPGQTGEAHLADEWQPQPPPPPPLPSPQRSRSSTRCRCCPHRRTATRAVSGKETAEPERVDGGYGSTKRARRERQREGGRTG